MIASRILRAASSASTIASASAGASSLARSKVSTHLTGLAVHPNPLPALVETYQSTLSLLETLPAQSVYRQACAALTQNRLDLVKRLDTPANKDKTSEVEETISEVERAIDAGQIEEVLIQAQDELKLAAKMLEWKS